jgi:AcrR family transcriptional regulator
MVSSETRRYELKARAESQRATRERIVSAAAELHEEVGVARTTVAEIARRAGVQRLTVYNHFPDLGALLPACSSHYRAEHPFPDLSAAMSLDDPAARVRAVLERVYAWYRETEPMIGKLTSDRASVPELDEFMRSNSDRALAVVADGLTADLEGGERSAGETRALVRLALGFETWQRLDREGLDDAGAADLMASCCAT